MRHVLLEPREILQAGDEWFNVDTHSWELTKEVGKPAHPSAIYRRPVKAPKWQTGLIPEPTGPSVLVLETVDRPESFCSFWYTTTTKEGRIAEWRWPNIKRHSLQEWLTSNDQWYTGRWYIQTISVPCS